MDDNEAPVWRAETNGLVVSVTPAFLEDQSEPEDGRFVWAYTVTLENRSEEALQLIARRWRITDARGKTETVEGLGVVGEQPLIEPGDTFTYTSACPLATPSGIMSGAYDIMRDNGEHFDATIPAFSLDSPYDAARVN